MYIHIYTQNKLPLRDSTRLIQFHSLFSLLATPKVPVKKVKSFSPLAIYNIVLAHIYEGETILK